MTLTRQLFVCTIGMAEVTDIVRNPENVRYIPNAPFFIGTGLVCAGALVREWCFHTMGSLFTFDIGIVEGHHRLITSGPYAFVR